MTLQTVYDGEDIPVNIEYTDASGNAIDPDDQGTDGVGDAYITITDESDTEQVSSVEMTQVSTGHYEYVWDTATAAGPGDYEVEISADFSSETKIRRAIITVQ